MSENIAFQEEQPSAQEARIVQYHECLTRQYPGLCLRWSRIYGKRWAHFLGGETGVSFSPLKVELNRKYGLCIENPEILSDIELGRVINLLREAFREPGA